jgi:hypothetical protein
LENPELITLTEQDARWIMDNYELQGRALELLSHGSEAPDVIAEPESAAPEKWAEAPTEPEVTVEAASERWVKAVHHCSLPTPEESHGKTTGSIWRCECGQHWELRRGYGFAPNQYVQVRRFLGMYF